MTWELRFTLLFLLFSLLLAGFFWQLAKLVYNQELRRQDALDRSKRSSTDDSCKARTPILWPHRDKAPTNSDTPST